MNISSTLQNFCLAAAIGSAVTVAPCALSAPADVLRVGVVQLGLAPTLGENRDRIVAGIGEVADHGGRLAVFPENALAGEGNDRADVMAAAIEAVRRAALARRIYVLFGGASRHPGARRDQPWVRAFGPDGSEVFFYEKLYSKPTAEMPGVFRVDGIPCSAMICADRWLRGVDEIPVQLGAVVSFELACNFASEWVKPLGWYWYAPRALRNNVWIVFANTGNAEKVTDDIPRHGHSAVVAPDGRLACALGETAGIMMTDIEPAAASRAEASARASHPALREFWDAGLRLQRGEPVSVPDFQPAESPVVDVTLAVSTVGGRASIIRAIADASIRGADLVAFPAASAVEADLPALREAARAHRLAVAVGIDRRVGTERRRSAFVLGNDGTILTCHDQLAVTSPFQPGTDLATMWFRFNGVPAVVTIGREALWTELAELAAVAGAQVHVHLECDADASPAAVLRRRQVWANLASFHTFTAAANVIDCTIWDDLAGALESRAVVRNSAAPTGGPTEIYSPFSANLVSSTSGAMSLIVATRRVSSHNPQFVRRTLGFNPQMAPWFRLGASLIRPR